MQFFDGRWWQSVDNEGRMPDHTTASAAIELGITRRRVLKLIKLGRLKAEKFGRDWRIEEADVQALKDSPRKAGRPKKDDQ